MALPRVIDDAARVLPGEMARALNRMDEQSLENAEEIRLRTGYEPTLLTQGGEMPFFDGRLVTGDDLDTVLQRATMSSLHTAREQLRHGFITCKGAVRIGVCGLVTIDGGISGIRDFSSIAIRIPRQVKGAGAAAVSAIIGDELSALIISPPGGGKTTFLRELIRVTSQGGTRVSVADERGEIAAVHDGRPMFDIGGSADVMSLCPKAQGAMMLLKSMNPQVIALDEITASEDIQAIREITSCGVRLYATAHARNPDDLKKRPLYSELLALGAFSCVVTISKNGKERKYEVMRI